MRVTVVGGGSWGTAFSVLLRDHGHEVTLACRSEEQALEIAATGHNPRYLTHVDLTGVAATTIAAASVADANLAVVAVPSAAFGATVTALPGNCPILSLTKGLDPATGNRLSTLVVDRPVAVLSGPNLAEEISRGLPAAAVIAGEDGALSVQLQLAITTPTFRVYVNDDVVGVELCAAAKRSPPAAPTASGSATTRRRRSSRGGSPRWAASPRQRVRGPRPSRGWRGWAT